MAVMGDIPAMVHTANPRVLVTQPSTKLDPRSREVRVSVASSVFSVDMAFGPEDDNQVVYPAGHNIVLYHLEEKS